MRPLLQALYDTVRLTCLIAVDVHMSKKPKTYFENELDRIYREIPFRPEQYVQVRQSKAFMEEFYSDRVELNDLAKAAFMSRFHYVRIFQRM